MGIEGPVPSLTFWVSPQSHEIWVLNKLPNLSSWDEFCPGTTHGVWTLELGVLTLSCRGSQFFCWRWWERTSPTPKHNHHKHHLTIISRCSNYSHPLSIYLSVKWCPLKRRNRRRCCITLGCCYRWRDDIDVIVCDQHHHLWMIAGDPPRNTLQRRTISYLRAVYTVYSGDVASIAPLPTPWNQVVMLSDFHFFSTKRRMCITNRKRIGTRQ